jgi:hypothetical protein
MTAAGKRVTVAEAKLVLDQLLSRSTKNRISKITGISFVTLTRIDNLTSPTVEKSIVDILGRLVERLAPATDVNGTKT